MGEGDSPLMLIGDTWRGLSVDGRRVSEARRDVSIGRRGVDGDGGVVKGRWDIDVEIRPLVEGVTTRTRFDGDLERIGLEVRSVGGTTVEDLDEFLTSWAFGVGVLGGFDTSLRVRVGVTGSRERP